MGGCLRLDSSHGFRVSDGFSRIKDRVKVKTNVPSKQRASDAAPMKKKFSQSHKHVENIAEISEAKLNE